MFNDSTVSKVVRTGLQKDLSHSTLHYKTGLTGEDGIRRVYNWDSVIDKYRDVLLANMLPVKLTDEEMAQYRFNPRMYCYKFYNNTDLWSTLLRLNNMATSCDFTRREFLSFGPKFNDVLREILMIEDDLMTESRVKAKTGE